MASSDEHVDQYEVPPRDRPFPDRRTFARTVTRVELAPAVARIAWSGVWGGFLIALGIWLTLITLGTGFGLSSLGPGSNLGASTISRATGGWLYVSGLIALFFGGVFGSRLAMVVDGAIAWLEATLIWAFALILITALTTAVVGVAAVHPVAASEIAQANPALANPNALTAAAWLTFFGIVIAWIVTVLGSFWGRAQARGRAQSLGLAA